MASISIFIVLCWICTFLTSPTQCQNCTGNTELLIPQLLPPRYDQFSSTHMLPLTNRVRVHQSCVKVRLCPDYHISAFFVHTHQCKLIIRRLDAIGFGKSLSISIQYRNRMGGEITEFFLIKTPPAKIEQNYVVVVLNVSFPLSCNESLLNGQQLIPKTIFQTYRTRVAQNRLHWQAYSTFVDLNPEYEIKMFTDKDCRMFIRRHFSSVVVEAYDVLIAPTFKADLFRYAYLALQGGCYFDHKMILRQPLRQVIRPSDELLVCSDAHFPSGLAAHSLSSTFRLYNAVICSSSKNLRMMQVLWDIVSNIKHRVQIGSDLGVTGPLAFFRALRSVSSSAKLPPVDTMLLGPTDDFLLFNATSVAAHWFKLREEEVRFYHGVHHKELQNRDYRDFYVKDKLHNTVFLHKFYPSFVHSSKEKTHVSSKEHISDDSYSMLLAQGGKTSRDLSRYSHLWREGNVYYENLGRYGPFLLLGFPGTRRQLKIVSSNFCGEIEFEGPFQHTYHRHQHRNVSAGSRPFKAFRVGQFSTLNKSDAPLSDVCQSPSRIWFCGTAARAFVFYVRIEQRKEHKKDFITLSILNDIDSNSAFIDLKLNISAFTIQHYSLIIC